VLEVGYLIALRLLLPYKAHWMNKAQQVRAPFHRLIRFPTFVARCVLQALGGTRVTLLILFAILSGLQV
jgi:hypothetical protein